MNASTFDEIVKLAGDFVTQQQGNWDHAEWLDFLSTLQKKGYEISEEAQGYVGQMLEATKSFYKATASTQGIEKTLDSVARRSVQFVTAHQGVWGHAEWEEFTRDFQQNTLSLTEETMAYLGGILESVKAFYTISGVSVPTPQKPVLTSPARKQPKQAKPQAAAAPEQPKPVKREPKQGTPQTKTATKPATGPAGEAEDDLTAIGGIGPALQRKLKEYGIRSFAQIAALSDEEIARLEGSIIKFPGRIKRDDWIGQARRFSEQTH